jgi:hypothetical protein
LIQNQDVVFMTSAFPVLASGGHRDACASPAQRCMGKPASGRHYQVNQPAVSSPLPAASIRNEARYRQY